MRLKRVTFSGPLCLGLALLAPAAFAQVNGFNGGTGYTINGDASFPDANTLNITNNQYFEANSVYYNTKVQVNAFVASFNFQLDPNILNDGLSPADGFTFVLQDDPNGLSAVGDAGGNLGYQGTNTITPSIAVAFNLYAGHTVGTNLLTDGVNPQNYNAIGGVNLIGDSVNVALAYSSGTLTETLTDLTNAAVYSTSYSIDIAGTLGSSDAYVGFTGGTGSGTSIQHLSSFQYQAVPEPSSLAGLACSMLGLLAVSRRRRR